MLKIVENGAVKEEGYTLDALAREGARRMLMSALERMFLHVVERHLTNHLFRIAFYAVGVSY